VNGVVVVDDQYAAVFFAGGHVELQTLSTVGSKGSTER